MHIGTRSDAAPGPAQPYLLDAGTICKSMSSWASPIVVLKTPEGLHSSFACVSILGS